VDQGGSERISGPDRVGHFDADARMLVAIFRREQQAASISARDANQLEVVSRKQEPRGGFLILMV
jgi:hypothetical protein